MRPVVLTNAFLRPRATRTSNGDSLSSDGYGVYACVEEMMTVIVDDLHASPIILPTKHDPQTTKSLLDRVDGIFLPGAVSNMAPSLYGEVPAPHPQVFDPAHDSTDLFLVEQAKERGIPFLGICRAMQAMNVSFGGSLGQKIETDQIDHACSYPSGGRVIDDRYMHDVTFTAGGFLAALLGTQKAKVNSMHEQHIARVGIGLCVEAVAEDGVIEALSFPAHPFFLGVQWHPEAMPQHQVSVAIFEAFANAAVSRAASR